MVQGYFRAKNFVQYTAQSYGHPTDNWNNIASKYTASMCVIAYLLATL
jgi:hypothetical protein